MWLIVDLLKSITNFPFSLTFDNFVYYVIPLLIVYYCFKQFKLYHKRKNCDLSGKTVLVTGGGNGFGKELCIAFSEQNCNIICVDVSVEGTEDTVKKIKAANKNVKVSSYICDVSNLDKVRDMAKLVYKEYDNIDILINNAGIAKVQRFLDMEESDIKRQMDVNLMSHFWVLKTFLPKMIQADSGYVVATSSILGRVGFECVIPYCTSKFGCSGLMESLQQELLQIDSNVKTLTIHPGFMGTNILPASLSTPGYRMFENKVPFYVQPPRDVADVVVQALKEEQREIYVPHYFITLVGILNMLPLKVRDYISKHTFKILPFASEHKGY